MKKSIILNQALILFFIAINACLFAQKPAIVFYHAFPELKGILDYNQQEKSLSLNQVQNYRNTYLNLNLAKKDIIAYESGILTKENSKVFPTEELTKIQDLTVISSMIEEHRKKIKQYLGSRVDFGADSLECIEKIALMQQFINSENYDEAYKYWNTLFHFYPRATKTIYSKGNSIIEYKINKEKLANAKNKWIDTLFMAYNQRILYFGDDRKYNEAYILGRKGIDILKYQKANIEEAYHTLSKSVNLQEQNSEPAVLLAFMQSTEAMFQNGKLDETRVVDAYFLLNDLLQKKLETGSDKAQITQAIEWLGAIFEKSRASACELLVPVFEHKLNNNFDDLNWIKQIKEILDRKKCTESDLYFELAAHLNQKEPNAALSYNLALASLKKNNSKNAIDYLNTSILLEQNDSVKSRYYLKLAHTLNELGQKDSAKVNASKAAELDKKYGAPLIFIAYLYASSGCSQLSMPKAEIPNAAYWAAVDKLNVAKLAEPALSDEINKLITSYSENFPKQESTFLYGISKGDKVTIGCWINENTKVRF